MEESRSCIHKGSHRARAGRRLSRRWMPGVTSTPQSGAGRASRGQLQASLPYWVFFLRTNFAYSKKAKTWNSEAAMRVPAWGFAILLTKPGRRRTLKNRPEENVTVGAFRKSRGDGDHRRELSERTLVLLSTCVSSMHEQGSPQYKSPEIIFKNQTQRHNNRAR